MTRLIVHAGFHKTGTTSAQKTLRKNRAALRPFTRIVLRAGMTPLCEAARAFSVSRSEWDLALVKYEAAQLAQTVPPGATALLSSEDLAGHMPGRRGLRRYDATPRLMAALHHAFASVHPGAQITLVFTTRADAPWLASCHAQHLRATRMTLTAREYARRFRASAALGEVVAQVAERVPDAQVVTAALEDCTGPLGPAAPLLDLAQVPRDVQQSLTALPPANTAPPAEMLRRLLALNRSDLGDADLKAAKRALNAERF